MGASKQVTKGNKGKEVVKTADSKTGTIIKVKELEPAKHGKREYLKYGKNWVQLFDNKEGFKVWSKFPLTFKGDEVKEHHKCDWEKEPRPFVYQVGPKITSMIIG